MEKYLIMCRSLTHAQRCQRLLEQSGIISSVIKAPAGLTQKGCGYSLVLRRHIKDALRVLRERNLLTGKVYQWDGTQWREEYDIS